MIRESMALITGIVFGFMLALVGILMVNQTYGLTVETENPLAWIPFQPKTIEAGITIENLGWQIFTGIVMALVIFIIVSMVLVMFLVQAMFVIFSVWSVLMFVAFSVFFWIGTMIVGMAG